MSHTVIKNAVKARDGHKCLCCGSRQRLTVDHVVPRSQGGHWTMANLQTLCYPCNQKKDTQTIDFRVTGVSLTDIRQRIENLKQIKTYLR